MDLKLTLQILIVYVDGAEWGILKRKFCGEETVDRFLFEKFHHRDLSRFSAHISFQLNNQ
jgi:hypothetical protein